MDKLQEIYNDPKYGFSSLNTFYKKLKEMNITVSYKTVKDFYNKQKINQVFREPKKRERSSIVAYSLFGCLQADLMDIKKFKNFNSGVKYLLNVIDVYSRYAWSIPVKSKKSKEISEALEKIFKECRKISKDSPETLTTDLGNEFVNKNLEQILDDYNIKHYTINSKGQTHPTVTAIVERFNYTLWMLIRKYTESINNLKFIDQLPNLVYNYNNREHSGISEKPINIYNKVSSPMQITVKAKTYDIGDLVRAKQHKKTFGKSYDPKYSNRIYKIHDIKGTTHYLTNTETNVKSRKTFQYDDLIKIPNDTENGKVNMKKQQKKQIEKEETIKRKNRATKLDTDDDGKIIIPKAMIPAREKRERKQVIRYGNFTK